MKLTDQEVDPCQCFYSVHIQYPRMVRHSLERLFSALKVLVFFFFSPPCSAIGLLPYCVNLFCVSHSLVSMYIQLHKCIIMKFDHDFFFF